MDEGGRLLTADDGGEWSATLRNVPHDTYHLPGYVRTAAEHAGGDATAFCYAEGSSTLLAPFVVRPVPGSRVLDAASPYGYSGPCSNVPVTDEAFWCRGLESMVATLRSQGVVSAFVRLHPLLAAPLPALRRLGEVVEHGQTVSVDLRLDDQHMWSMTRRTHRTHINRARRAGVTTSWDDWPRLGEWREVYEENMRLLGADAGYYFAPAYYAALAERMPEQAHLVLAELNGDVIAGHIVFEENGIVSTHLVGMRTSSRPTHPDKLVYHEVRRWARSRGNHTYHLGGGYGGRSDGLFEYKAGFADRRHVFRTWRVVTDRHAYEGLTHAPPAGQRDDFFPPYRHPSAQARTPEPTSRVVR